MLSAKAIAVPALHGGSYRFGIWQIGSQAKYTLTSTSLARASIDQEANKLPAVIASSQQQALDQARQVLLKKRKTDPQYATLPAFLGGTVSVDSLKQKLFTDTVLNQIDPIAMQVCTACLPACSEHSAHQHWASCYTSNTRQHTCPDLINAVHTHGMVT